MAITRPSGENAIKPVPPIAEVIPVIVEPLTDPALALKKLTVPPAAPLLKAVTMELVLTFSLPVAVMLPARVKNVTSPLVFTLRFVNVLVLTFVVVELALVQVM